MTERTTDPAEWGLEERLREAVDTFTEGEHCLICDCPLPVHDRLCLARVAEEALTELAALRERAERAEAGRFPLSSLACCLVDLAGGRPLPEQYAAELPEHWARLVRSVAARVAPG